MRVAHSLALCVVAAGCCNNGESGLGQCFATVIDDETVDGRKMVFASFGPIGRREAEKVALSHCGLPQNTDPSEILFTDSKTYIDENGDEAEYVIYDVKAYFFKCREPGKDSQ